jgi:two-component system chemotaxis response regulator CheY
MRKIIMRSLKAIGITDITEAADGDQAISTFASGQFHLVLTDWNMPKKTGLDVIHAIRDSGSQVPIIMVTTEAERERVMEAIQAGVTDYLTKPFEADALRNKLVEYALV